MQGTRVLLGEYESHQRKSTMSYIGISISYNNLRQFPESLQGKCPVSNVTTFMEAQSLAFCYGFICNPFYSIRKLLFRDHFYHKKCCLLTSSPFFFFFWSHDPGTVRTALFSVGCVLDDTTVNVRWFWYMLYLCC